MFELIYRRDDGCINECLGHCGGLMESWETFQLHLTKLTESEAKRLVITDPLVKKYSQKSV